MKIVIFKETGLTDEKIFEEISVANKKEYKIDRLSKERIECCNCVNLRSSSKLLNKQETFLRNKEFVCNSNPPRC